MSVMHYAARYASPLLVQVLLRCGASIHLRTNENRLPAEEAEARGRMEIVSLIRSYRSGLVDHLSRLEFLAAALMERENAQDELNEMDIDEDLRFGRQSLLSLPLDCPALFALNEP